MTNKEKNQPFKDMYLVYNRKSTDDAENQKNSLAYQLTENIKLSKKERLPIAGLTIPGFCEKGIINESHSGFKESDDFSIGDDGSIKYKIDRPKFAKLVNMLNNREVKGVISCAGIGLAGISRTMSF